ncbi:hypothetical protein [Rhodococcus marinonascens]|uniref:hypothetical protein n=1 Tax=Rhodococcus marinonascens TaxID=38311 RepID=UPI000ADC3B35|nr:hypothetical protein [Rhodococcus marinonascens]
MTVSVDQRRRGWIDVYSAATWAQLLAWRGEPAFQKMLRGRGSNVSSSVGHATR